MTSAWAVTPAERAKFAAQFASVQPNALGLISGTQAKSLFVQSQLPAGILAQIWSISDLNADGQMDLMEFSIACKMITMKLKGVEVPNVLPQPLLASLQQPPPSVPQSVGSMVGGPGSLASSMGLVPAPVLAGQPGVMQLPPMMPAQPAAINLSTPMMTPYSMSTQPMQPMMTTMSMVQPLMNVGQMGMPPSSLPSWPIPDHIRNNYQNTFLQNDKAKAGFLAGVQARNILLQTQLPQNVLAQIWNLSDVDNNGKLSLEEFILAGYLCDLALKGEPLPPKLPPHLVPPSMRPGVVATSINQGGGGDHENVATPGSTVGATSVEASLSSFEDRRRENFNKGQAELERRRQSLAEQQRKEKEEKERKEKEEAEAREKARKELEKKRLQEWEQQRKDELNQHRKMEQQALIAIKAKKEHMQSEMERVTERAAELTRNIGESRGGIAEIKSTIDSMRSSRDTKLADMSALRNKLKEQNQRMIEVTQEKAHWDARVNKDSNGGELEEQLTEFEAKKRTKIQSVEELRSKLAIQSKKENELREKYESIKAQMEEKRRELEQVHNEVKEKHLVFDEQRRELRAEKNKKIRELTDPDHFWGEEKKQEKEPLPGLLERRTSVQSLNLANGDDSLKETTTTTPTVVTFNDNDRGTKLEYRALYDYDAQKDDELSFRENDVILIDKEREAEPGWLIGNFNNKEGWLPEAFVEPLSASSIPAMAAAVAASINQLSDDNVNENTKRTVVKDYSDNELKSALRLTKGDVVNVIAEVDEEWIYGYDPITKNTGHFPVSAVVVGSNEMEASHDDQPLMKPNNKPMEPEELVAYYAYHSDNSGDLIFHENETIVVVKKESDWWTGFIQGEPHRHGLLPYNYVGPKEEDGEKVTTTTAMPTATMSAPSAETGVIEQQATDESSSRPRSSKSTKKKHLSGGNSKKNVELARVLAPYEATSKEQLSLTQGQILIVKKKMASGWWQGELQQAGSSKKKSVGWFPATFVTLLESKSNKQQSNEEPLGGDDDLR